MSKHLSKDPMTYLQEVFAENDADKRLIEIVVDEIKFRERKLMYDNFVETEPCEKKRIINLIALYIQEFDTMDYFYEFFYLFQTKSLELYKPQLKCLDWHFRKIDGEYKLYSSMLDVIYKTEKIPKYADIDYFLDIDEVIIDYVIEIIKRKKNMREKQK